MRVVGGKNSPPFPEPIDYMLKRWDAPGRKASLFAGPDRGADRTAFMAPLINSAKLKDIDPLAWLADVLAHIADTPVTRLAGLLQWNRAMQAARLAA